MHVKMIISPTRYGTNFVSWTSVVTVTLQLTVAGESMCKDDQNFAQKRSMIMTVIHILKVSNSSS